MQKKRTSLSIKFCTNQTAATEQWLRNLCTVEELQLALVGCNGASVGYCT